MEREFQKLTHIDIKEDLEKYPWILNSFIFVAYRDNQGSYGVSGYDTFSGDTLSTYCSHITRYGKYRLGKELMFLAVDPLEEEKTDESEEEKTIKDIKIPIQGRLAVLCKEISKGLGVALFEKELRKRGLDDLLLGMGSFGKRHYLKFVYPGEGGKESNSQNNPDDLDELRDLPKTELGVDAEDL